MGRTALAFVASALLAALAGTLLSAYSGGAFLEVGSPDLLQAVDAVVLDGTLFGSILLVPIIVTMQVAGLPLGTQGIVQGVAIPLALAGPAR